MKKVTYYTCFLETPRKFIIAELSMCKLGSSSFFNTNEDPSFMDPKLCNSKFTCCFHKAEQVYFIDHANVQGSYISDRLL